MLNDRELVRLAEEGIGTTLPRVTFVPAAMVYAQKQADVITVGGSTVAEKLRALTLVHLHKEEEEFCFRQKPRFQGLGVMVDTSRGGVLRVEKVKEFLLKTTLMGSNRFMLYTEDIYTLEDYPHFGYCRGAYTDEELSEIVAYADLLEVELIPCIQTLGHMAQYLSWKSEVKDFKDCDATLLCDAEQTYTFIEACVAKMKKLFHTNRIHIGMDEATDIGLGQYLERFGYQDRYDILLRHLDRVCAICQKYGLSPMMWSDMFFALASKEGNYYNSDFQVTEELKQRIPAVDLVYWDYYHSDQSVYDRMFFDHQKMGRPILFAGGVQSYRGFLCDIEYTFRCTEPALASCIEQGVGEVWATMWGDDGHEFNVFDQLYAYAMFTEICYDENYTMDSIQAMGMVFSRLTPALQKDIACYFYCERPRNLIWGDIFYQLLGVDFQKDTGYLPAKEAAEHCTDPYTRLVLRILYQKAFIYAHMQQDYKNGADMRPYAETILPALLSDYRDFFRIFSDMWLENYKVFGYEVLQMRFHATIGRLEYAIRILGEYVNGKRKSIEELEYIPQYGVQRSPFFNFLVSGRAINFF